MPRAVIRGTGACVPSRVVPNSEFDAHFGAGIGDWLEANLEIRERRWCAEGESTADLCVGAAESALTRAGVTAAEIDLLIVATDTAEYVSPSTAAVVQHRLGAHSAGTFDLNAACAGFVTGLDVASKYLAIGEDYRHALVIGAYAMSRFLDPDDKYTVTLFADGAAAVVLSASDDADRGVLRCRLRTEGQYHDWMGIYAGGARRPATAETVAAREHCVRFVRKFPKAINPDTWTDMCRGLAADVGVEPTDVDCYVFTQVNIQSIRETLDRLGVSHDRAPTVMHEYGYTGSACIPLALDHAATTGRLRRGDLVFLIASGGGLAFAAMALRW